MKSPVGKPARGVELKIVEILLMGKQITGKNDWYTISQLKPNFPKVRKDTLQAKLEALAKKNLVELKGSKVRLAALPAKKKPVAKKNPAKTKRVKTPTGYRYMVDGKFAAKDAYDKAKGKPVVAKKRTAKKNPTTGLSDATAMQAMMHLQEQGWQDVKYNKSWLSFTGWTKTKPHRKVTITAVFTQPKLTSDSVKVRLMARVGSDASKRIGTWTLSRSTTAVPMPESEASKRYLQAKPAAKGKSKGKRPGLLAGFFSNPADMKKAWATVSRVFKEERTRMQKKFPKLEYTGLRPNDKLHDSERHFAAAGKDKDGIWVEAAPVLGTLPISKIRGVIRHELGHAAILHGHEPMVTGRTKQLSAYDRRERQADRVAEKLSGARIYYDAKNIEASGPGAKGKRPRPAGVR